MPLTSYQPGREDDVPLTSYQPLRRFQGPLTAAGVGEIVTAPRTAAEGNLGETIRLLSLALLQASDAEGCPCCGEDEDLPEGHLAGCCWPELVRLGYVDAARPRPAVDGTGVELPTAPVPPGVTPAQVRAHGQVTAALTAMVLGEQPVPVVPGLTPGCLCSTCSVADCAERQQADLLATPDPEDLLPAAEGGELSAALAGDVLDLAHGLLGGRR